jgi:hypothetical protein
VCVCVCVCVFVCVCVTDPFNPDSLFADSCLIALLVLLFQRLMVAGKLGLGEMKQEFIGTPAKVCRACRPRWLTCLSVAPLVLFLPPLSP